METRECLGSRPEEERWKRDNVSRNGRGEWEKGQGQFLSEGGSRETIGGTGSRISGREGRFHTRGSGYTSCKPGPSERE